MARIYALSLKQPWAALVVSGRKAIEVRSWSTRVRGRVLIHAARVPDSRKEAWQWVTDREKALTGLEGGIIGSAEVAQCIRYGDHDTFVLDADLHLNDPDWFQPTGLYGFVLRKAQVLPFRRLPGNVRFFTVEEE